MSGQKVSQQDLPLALIVPLFDEAKRVETFIPELLQYIQKRPSGSELIFVDDGSTDITTALTQELLDSSEFPFASLLLCPHRGKGTAVRAGIAASTAPCVGYCDLDLSTPLTDFDKIVDAASRREVLAIGSRDVTGSRLLRRQSLIRESLGRSYNRLLQATVVPGVVDTQCGAKAALRSVWERLLPFCSQKGFAWDAELVAVARALEVPIQEIPIDWAHKEHSKVRLVRDGLSMVFQTPRLLRSARSAARCVNSATPSLPHEAPAVEGVFEGAHAEDLIAADRDHWWFRSKAAFVATALKKTTGPSTGYLADVGAGAGGVTAMLGWDPARVILVEASDRLVRHARDQHGFNALRGLAENLPLADRSVDVLCLLDVVEHLDDPAVVLEEARRVLSPGGRVLITVPAHRWLWSNVDIYLGHRRRYTTRMLRDSLMASKLTPLLLSHIFSWLVVPVLIERRLRRAKLALGLERTSLMIDRSALLLTAIERHLLDRPGLPMGTSILCVATAEIRNAD